MTRSPTKINAYPTWLKWAADQLTTNLDWSRPELAGMQGEAGDDPMAIARTVAAHLRSRPTPHLGYTAADVERARALVDDRQRDIIAERLAAASESVPRVRRIGLFAVPAEDLYAAARPEHFHRQAEFLAEDRPFRDPPVWGTLACIVEMVQVCWPLDTCDDDFIIFLLAWVSEQWHPEWEYVRTWSETTLGLAGHNWWVHALRGFWKAGLFFPEVKELGQFAALGPTWLNRELPLLIRADGFSIERSGYHWPTVKMAHEMAHIARLNGVELSAAVHQRLRAADDSTWQLITPDGEIPHIGDGFRETRAHPCIAAVRLAAARHGIREAKFVAEALQIDEPETLVDFGEDLKPAYDAVQPLAPRYPDTCLPISGYYVIRENWTNHADWMCIDAGSTGNRGGSHDHADIFGFTLYAKGRPVLLDNGAGSYSDDAERRWRISTAAHNAATVDGADHLEIVNQWRRGNRTIPLVDAWICDERFTYFSGAHDGYETRPPRIAGARRKIFYLRGGYWIVLDRFSVEEFDVQHRYQQHFHLAQPTCQLENSSVLAKPEQGEDTVQAGLLVVPWRGWAWKRHWSGTRTRGTDTRIRIISPTLWSPLGMQCWRRFWCPMREKTRQMSRRGKSTL